MGKYMQPDGSFKTMNECPVCHEDLNMYGGCACNGYTYAGNKEYIIGIDIAKGKDNTVIIHSDGKAERI